MASIVTLNGIDVSPLDERQYETFVLSNALQVCIISDPKTEKAAAAMDVHVGHQSDFDDLPGLAHFLEHMLFLGTAKYPDENSYKTFLSAHSGRSNASTSQTHTNFYFDVLSAHLYEALDRFSQFFIAPLFTPEATEREMNAVNSENSKNLQNDHRRLYQLQKSLSNPLHPFHKFGTGNLETLGTLPRKRNIDVRAALLDFYATYYSASIMKLVICGKEPLATLKSWAEALFSDIPNTGRSVPRFGNAIPFDDSRVGRVIQVTPVKDLRIIDISWPLPSLHGEFLTKPTKILAHLIGHEGAGSILSHLKAQKWANGLSAGLCRDEEDWALFCVKIDATEAGIEQLNDVVQVVFQYIQILQQQTPFESWIFQETQNLACQNFRFKSKENPITYTSHVATAMHRYPPQYILTGNHLLYEYDPKKVEQMLDRLTPSRMRLTIVSKTFQGTTEKVEKWYETPYSDHQIEMSLVRKWMSPPPNPALHLPHRNPFVCTDFTIVSPASSPSSSAAVSSPVLLQEDPTCRLWYKPDLEFRKPKLLVHFLIYTPAIAPTPSHAVLTSLFIRYLKDTLTEVAYDAELAGMEYEIGLHARAFELFVGGYSEKLDLLLSQLFDHLLAMTSAVYSFDSAIFERVKDQTKRMYENLYVEEPYHHAIYLSSQVLEIAKWSVHDKLQAIDHVTIADLAAHSQSLFQQVFLEGLCYGNRTQTASLGLMQHVMETFRARFPLMPSQRNKPRIVHLVNATEYRLEQREWNHDNVNSALCLLYQVISEKDDETLRIRARLELFAHLFKEPFFHQLRTQEQLGYLVFSGLVRMEGVWYFRLLIQSNVASPQVVNDRIERFLVSFRSVLTGMTRSLWQKHVQAVVHALLERPKYEMEESMRLWREIVHETFRFDRRKHVAAIVSTLQPRDLVELFDTFFALDGNQRSKLSIGLYGAKHPLIALEKDKEVAKRSSCRSTVAATGIAAAMLLNQKNKKEKEKTVHVIDDINRFRREMALFPEAPAPTSVTRGWER